MAKGVENAADKASKATEGMGDGAEKSADKFTRAESRMRDAIKKSTEQLQLLGKTASEKLEFNINAKGLDASKFAPYIEELKKAEAAQRIATGGLDKMGISAAQTAAALRGVPAQVTDIITSLQGGQAPLTVFLQQGGQLKDMFGGAGAAARALGGYVVGLINPFTLAAAGAAALAVAYNQGSKEADAYRQALVLTGNQAGATVGQMQQMAQQIAVVTGSQREAAAALATFASSGKVGQENLRQFTQSAIEFSRVTGQSIDEVAKNFADLAKDPLKATLKLNESMNFLTESIFRQIQSLQDQGRETEAANVAQKAYADTLDERKGEIVRNLGTIEKAWAAIKKEANSAMDAFLDIGRLSTLETRLQRAQSALQSYQTTLPGKRTTAQVAAVEQFGGEEGLKREIAGLQDLIENQRKSAEMERERAAAVKASTDLATDALKYESDLEKQRRAVLSATEKYQTALAKGNLTAEQRNQLEADYLKLVSGITAVKEKKGGSGGLAAENKELRDQQRIFAELADVSSTYYADLATAQKERAKGNISEAQYVKYVEELIQKQPFAVAAAKAHAEAIKDEAKAAAESSKALGAWYEVREKESQSLQNQINARREEVSMMGMTTEAVIEYTRAKFEQQAAEKEAYASALESASFYAGEYAQAYMTAAEAARQQAAQLRELGGLEIEKANQEAAKKAAEEWKRASDDINRSLTDALLRGFESGKDFAKNLRDTLKNMFSTLVLRPIISAAMSPVAGAINGMLYGNAAAAAGGGASALGMLGSGANLITGLQGTQGMLGTVGGWLGLNTVATNAGLAATIGIDAASAAAAANAAGAAGGGLLSGVGSALPWIGGIAALVSILGGLDDSGTYHTGGAAQYSGARGLMSGQDATGYGIGFGRVERGQETIDTVSRLAQGLAQSLDGVATSFGRTAGFEIATAFADDTSKDGAWGAFRISLDGRELLNWENDRQSKWGPREFADGQEGYQQYLNTIAKDTRQVLMDMDLASWADKLLTGLGETPTMEALTNVIAQINQIQSAFEGLGNSMAMFADLTDEMQSGLLDAAGSIEALTAGAGAFYQGFYSEQERIDAAVAQLNEALTGLDLSIDPRLGADAKDQFRAAVQAAMDAGDAELAAALLALSGTFANTADYFQQLASQQADTMGRLQIDLLRAQGDNLAAVALERERELAALAQFGPAAVAMQQQIYGLIDAMAASNAAANAYFADIDRAAAEQGYTDDAQAALDAMFGSISGGADAAAQSAASAAADAAQAAAASWRSAASSIKSSLEKLRADTTALSDPASRYAETKSVLDEYTRLALGGDASAAEKLAGAADAFLSASADGTMTQAEYLRDRVLTEAKLASVMESSEAQASLQESIASSAGAAVSELQALNSNLTGFAGDLYDLLRNSYSDVGRDGATGIAATFAKMQADFEAYFSDNTRFAVGSKYSDPSFGGASFTKLDNNMAQFTGADGVVNYLRAGESLLDVAKRIPELRKLWEQQYGIRLPAFAVGTNYVPRDMLAQIHEGEAIVPKAFNPWANGGSTGGDNEALIAELRTVTAQLVKVEARLAEIEKTNDQMAQQQDNGTDGGNAYRAEIMNVAALAQAIKEATV